MKMLCWTIYTLFDNFNLVCAWKKLFCKIYKKKIMKRKADDLPEALKTVIKKCPPNEYRAPIYWVNKHSLPPRKLYDMDVYIHYDMKVILDFY